jgi:hypothetical protein
MCSDGRSVSIGKQDARIVKASQATDVFRGVDVPDPNRFDARFVQAAQQVHVHRVARCEQQ